MPRLSAVTWNLNGLDALALDQRTEAACLKLLLRPDPPDVVGLQEVVRRSWHAHLKHHFAAAGYHAIPTDPTATDSGYFCALLVRGDHRILEQMVAPFPGSRMGRNLVAARVTIGDRVWWFGTAHLESGKAGSGERVRQARQVWEAMGDLAWFGGDTNLRKDEAGVLPDGLVDAWEASGSAVVDRATWPAQRGRRPGARFDRSWVRGAAVADFSLFGRKPALDFDGPPSDHLGVRVELVA